MPVDTVTEHYITLYGALLLNVHIPIAKFCDDIIERSVNEHGLYNALFWDLLILITESISFCNERYCTVDVHIFNAEICDNLYRSVMSVLYLHVHMVCCNF